MASTQPEITIVQKGGKILSVYATERKTRVYIVDHDNKRPSKADIDKRNTAIRRLEELDMYGVY